MSRIGRRAIIIPKGVKVTVGSGNAVTIEGPKGKVNNTFPAAFKIEVTPDKVLVKSPSMLKSDKIMHGTIRSHINNMVKGAAEGYQRNLEIVGVGYKAQVQGKTLNIQLGFTHPISYPIAEGVTIETPKPTQIVIKSMDKAKIGKAASEIRSYFKPEPYKGKGIRYAGEYVRRKAGKAIA